MLITLKIVLRTLVLPPAGPLLAAAAGAWLLRPRASARSHTVGWALLGASLASLWVLATPVVADALIRVAARVPAIDLTHPLSAQAIVILGGAEHRTIAPEYGGEPAAGAELLERLTYGAYLAHRTALPVLVTGSRNEALAMQRVLERDFGVEPRWVERDSRDTFENAEFSARMLKAAGVSRIVLVTDAAHEWRALHEFAGAGLSVEAAPVGLPSPPEDMLRYLPSTFALARSTQALYELLGDAVREGLAALGLRRQTAL